MIRAQKRLADLQNVPTFLVSDDTLIRKSVPFRALQQDNSDHEALLTELSSLFSLVNIVVCAAQQEETTQKILSLIDNAAAKGAARVILILATEVAEHVTFKHGLIVRENFPKHNQLSSREKNPILLPRVQFLLSFWENESSLLAELASDVERVSAHFHSVEASVETLSREASKLIRGYDRKNFTSRVIIDISPGKSGLFVDGVAIKQMLKPTSGELLDVSVL